MKTSLRLVPTTVLSLSLILAACGGDNGGGGGGGSGGGSAGTSGQAGTGGSAPGAGGTSSGGTGGTAAGGRGGTSSAAGAGGTSSGGTGGAAAGGRGGTSSGAGAGGTSSAAGAGGTSSGGRGGTAAGGSGGTSSGGTGGGAAGGRGGSSAGGAGGGGVSTAVANIQPTSGNTVQGTATFTDSNGVITMSVQLTSCPMGQHAMHLHEMANCAQNGDAAGMHWVPKGEILGAITCSAAGTGTLMVTAPSAGYWTIGGAAGSNILPHAVMVHASPDPSSGARIGCGVIVPAP